MIEESLSDKIEVATEFETACFSTSQAVVITSELKEAVKKLKKSPFDYKVIKGKTIKRYIILETDLNEIMGPKLI